MSKSETQNPTAATSTTPTGLFALLLASGGNFLLPIVLSAAQLVASRRWPDTDIPQDIERAKVVVNVAGAATMSLVAALKHWRVARMAAAATERTALLAGQTQSTYPAKTSKRRAGEKRRVRFDADLIDINMKEDQAQMAVSLPVL
jgi:malic enzyme